MTTAESQVLQQEMILKNYLTRGGLDNLGGRRRRASFPPTTSTFPRRKPSARCRT